MAKEPVPREELEAISELLGAINPKKPGHSETAGALKTKYQQTLKEWLYRIEYACLVEYRAFIREVSWLIEIL